MPDYIIDFTDPANGSFVIKPYTTNGPATPRDPTPLDAQAVTANTSLVLLGQGMFQYGERFQESVVHMLEHFAYDTAPVYPIQGQIWFKNTPPEGLFVYDGTTWQVIIVGGFPIAGNLDMGGFRIENLGDPNSADDAVNLGFADTRYVNVTGDTMTGNLVMSGLGVQVTLPNAPVVGTDAVNKTYVDNVELADLDDVAIVGPVLGEFLQYDGAFWTNVATAIPTALDDLSDVIITGIPGLGEVLTYDGAAWVNQAPAASTDRYVLSGAIVSNTLTLTMSTAVPSPTVVISGAIAVVGHTHITQNIFHDENPQSFDSSYIRDARVSTVASPNPLFPQNDPFNNAVDAIDQVLYVARSPHKRRVLQSDGTVGPYPVSEYITYTNKLSVSVNGVKQYASSRGTASLIIDSPTANSATNTGLTTADFPITAANTGPATFEVTGNQAATFPIGTQFSVIGSTGNDGVYTVIAPGATFAVVTTIPVAVVPNAVAGGIISVVSVLDYRFGINVDVVDFPAGTTVTNVTVRPAPLEVSLAIISVDTGSDTFVVSGDYTTVFTAGRAFVVTGSTGNNGIWQVLSSVLIVSNTFITIDSTPSIVANTDVTDSTGDGLIAIGYVSFAGLVEEMQIEADTALANDVTIIFKDSSITFAPDSIGNTSTVELVNPSSGTNLYVTLNATFTASEILYDGYESEVNITAVDTVNDEFDVAGDYTVAFPAGARFTIQGTTGFAVGIPITHGSNDGVFQVDVGGATFAAGTTTIPVTANLTVDTLATGTIYFSRELAYEESGTPFDENIPGTSITFTTAPTAGALIEVTVVP